MIRPDSKALMPVLYIPHGGGPLPLLNDRNHLAMNQALAEIPASIATPRSILLISAHWEAPVATITESSVPDLVYDYYGFAEEAYDIKYPAPGNTELAHRIYRLLDKYGIESSLDGARGFDHGMFVPLKIIFPEADIPCVQLSLLNDLDAEKHILLGEALTTLRREGVLIIGSGMSFHNLRVLFNSNMDSDDQLNSEFQQWLLESCCSPIVNYEQSRNSLIHWRNAPNARFVHPREEHLLPLHVCLGAAGGAEFQPAEPLFDGRIMGKRSIGLKWG